MSSTCENCGGEGLVHQGESIKFTCSVCSGTGKSVDGSEEEHHEDVVAPEEVKSEAEESFLDGASEDSSEAV